MLEILSAVSVLLAVPGITGFSVFQPKVTRLSRLHYHPLEFDRAVDCAENFGLCDVDELLDLSAELEEYQGCFYEATPEDCDKEISDRHDLAEVLYLQSELRERNRYVNEANLFAFDINEDGNMHDRDDFFDNIAPSMDI